MLKTLIIVRHGQYDVTSPRRELDEVGRQQIGALREKLLPYLGEATIILTSPHARTQQSADILAGDLSIEVIENELLVSGPGARVKLVEVLALIREHRERAEVIVLVTHLEYTDQFPPFFGKYFLGTDEFSRGDLEKGEAYVIDCIDCREKIIEKITP